jgi:hypothetical protein
MELNCRACAILENEGKCTRRVVGTKIKLVSQLQPIRHRRQVTG